MATTFSKIRAGLAETLALPEDDICEDSRLVEDLGADSLDLAEVILLMEELWGLDVPDDQIEEIYEWTAGELAQYVDQRLRTSGTC